MKILILRFSSIGDIVLTTPIVRCIKSQLNCEIHFLTKKKFSGVINDNPYIDKVITFDKSTAEVLSILKAENYTYVIDLHKNTRSRLLRFRLAKKAFSFSKLNISKWLLVNFKIDLLPKDKHIVDRYFDGIKALKIENDNNGLDYFISPKDDDFGIGFLKKHEAYNVLVLGANYFTKRIPIELCEKIIEKSPLKVVLLGGQDVIGTSDLLASKKNKVINLVSSINLNQSASTIKYANKVYTSDTGLMHIAAAYNKDIEIFWGSTDKRFGMYPYMPNESKRVKHHEVLNLGCRPCSKIGYEKCPKGHFKCMLNQEI